MIYLALNGQQELVKQIVADAQTWGINCLRVFCRCVNLFPLDGNMPGFWEAVEFVRATLNDGGIYFKPVIILDRYKEDGHGGMIELMGDSATDQWVAQWRDWCRGKPGVLPALVNEPEQKWQGYSGPTDSRLLRYADDCAAAWGHKDFIIGAAADGDNPDASEETIRMSVEVAKHVNLIAIHDSRMGGAAPDGSTRIRRWVDHIEGFVEVVHKASEVNDDVHGVHEEPFGMASQRWVPISNGKTYEREYDPQMALAGALTGFVTGTTYCYHRIRSQDPGQPGIELIAQVLRGWPATATYINDSWTGSPSSDFAWVGGKCRWFVTAPNGVGFIYGFADKKVVPPEWANGYAPVPTGTDYDGSECTTYTVRQH